MHNPAIHHYAERPLQDRPTYMESSNINLVAQPAPEKEDQEQEQEQEQE